MDEPAGQEEPEKSPETGIFSELKRRKVFSFTAGYIFAAWFLIEVASVVLPAFDAPESVLRILIIGAVAFAPVGILLAWYYDLSRKGLVLTEPAEEKIEAEAPPEKEGVAEHRLITVLQVSISPSTNDVELAEQYRKLLPKLQDHFQQVVQRYGGYMAVSESEIVTAYFGVDTVVEAASVRALHVAQEFIDYVGSRNRQVPDLAIAVCAGVDSGFAIVDTGLDKPSVQLISNFGQTLRSVSMLQLSCPSNEIRISQRVYELVRSRSECEPVGTMNLPGGDEESAIYRVTREAQPKLQLARYEIVGRENELGLIEQCLQKAGEDNGQVVILRGEAGIGKSRLVNAAFDIAAQNDASTIIIACSAFHTHSSLYPVIKYIQELIDPNEDLEDPALLAALENLLIRYELSVPELLPVFAHYLSIDSSDYQIIEPELQKRRFLDALHTILFTAATQQTTLLLIEDLHWADPTFMELMDLLIPSVAGSKIMALMTCRPAFRAAWTDASHVNLLNINPLNSEQSRALIKHLDAAGMIDDARIDLIIKKAEGVPLYLEEFARLLVENADIRGGTDNELSLPDTLQDSLAARFDHLGTTKSVLNLGATIGREFSFALIERAMDIPTDELDSRLSELVAKDVIFRRGIGNRTILVFKHILIQEAVYQSMLKSQREFNHLAVAVAIEEATADTGEQHPEILARHFQEAEAKAGHIDKSISYWMKAAGFAIHRTAIIEADHFLSNALNLIEQLPPSETRDATHLNIQTQRFPVLVALRGYSSESMTAASERALELCDSVSGFESRFAAMFGICIVYMVAGEHVESQKVAQRIASISSGEDDAFRLEAHMLLGLTSFFLGDLKVAEQELCRSLELYEFEKHADHGYLYGQDPSVISLCYLTWTYFSLGKTTELQATLERLKARAKSLNHPNSTGFSLSFTAWEMVFSNRLDSLPDILEEMEQLSEKFGLVSFHTQGQLLAGLAQCREGDFDVGLQNVEQGLEAWKAIGSRCYLPLWYCYFAKACIDAGSLEKAETALQNAEQELLETGESWAECEIYNRRAELAMRCGDHELAAQFGDRALEQAHASGTLGWKVQSAVA